MMPVKYTFGPFLARGALREGMKIIRKLFPYRDRCTPPEELSEQLKERLRPCFSHQLGLCPGVCIGRLSEKEYAETITHIRLFFEGKKKLLVKQLEKQMRHVAKEERFERADELKRTLFGLRHIRDIALIKDDVREILAHRVEAYDVSHIMGEASVGVRVVVQNNVPAKDEYRMFILRDTPRGDDLKGLEEILTRRLKHEEWPLPEIIVVDGGENHFRTAERVLAQHGLAIPIVAVVKNVKHQPSSYLGAEGIVKRFKKEILLANAEAHRFAITFHRKRRGREFLGRV
jgi:excinuclease ABC subunit C